MDDDRLTHGDDYSFCTLAHKDPLQTIRNPYSEDHYCCWCGNGDWKFHGLECEWADAHGL